METWEIAEQEDLISVLIATLSKGWSEQYGESFEISGASQSRAAQEWSLQPTFTTLYTSDVSRTARRFMVDRFKYTPIAARAPFQWMLGTALGSRIGLKLQPQALLKVHPPVPGAADVVIVPGSRRVRTFDFNSGLSRSFLKAGYPLGAIINEVAVRNAHVSGPFFPVTDAGKDDTWFEEPIIEGFPLPRCPPWWPRERYADQALAALGEWLSVDTQTAPAGARAEALMNKIGSHAGHLLQRFPQGPVPTTSLIESLVERAESLGEVQLAHCHGDLQPGNIHVSRRSREVYLIDWEHTGIRWSSYDFLTYGLRARYPMDLGVRILRFIDEEPAGPAFGRLPCESQRKRTASIALFLLEELDRSLTDAATTPYRRLPYGFKILCREISSIQDHLRLRT